MRLALVLLLVTGCAKKAGEPAATTSDRARESAVSAPTAPPPPTNQAQNEVRDTESGTGESPPKGTVGAAPGGGAGSGSAIDHARASGVLGPTDQHAFAVTGNVTVKSASTKQLDAAAKTNLDAVKACYDKALEYKDTLVGELTVSVKDGKPTLAKSTLKNPELEKCVVAALTALPASGKATLVLAFKRE